ncbi:MAG: YybS family protein [Anaerobacillus sp.]|uniref:YybS family protein n=1 Tax=Anaerobacillus sp. TaxID=1872506 RepID=UPI003918D6D6
MKKTKVLTEGAIFAAIYAIMAFMTVIIPILATVLLWILPLPFIIYTVRNGWKAGLMLWIVASFVSFIIGGLVLIFSAIIFGSTGIMIGQLYRSKKSAFTVLFGGSIASIANLILFFILSIVVLDIHPIEGIQELMRTSVETAEVILISIGQDGKQLEEFLTFIDRLMVLAPALLISTGIFYALFIQLIAYAVLKRIGEKVARFQPFRDWSFPKSFLWYYLVASILILIGLDEGTALYMVMWNLFPLLEIAMTVQGLAVIMFYCHAKGLNKSIPVFIIIVTFIAPFLLYIYRILGIIDLGFELRKRIKNVD